MSSRLSSNSQIACTKPERGTFRPVRRLMYLRDPIREFLRQTTGQSAASASATATQEPSRAESATAIFDRDSNLRTADESIFVKALICCFTPKAAASEKRVSAVRPSTSLPMRTTLSSRGSLDSASNNIQCLFHAAQCDTIKIGRA